MCTIAAASTPQQQQICQLYTYDPWHAQGREQQKVNACPSCSGYLCSTQGPIHSVLEPRPNLIAGQPHSFYLRLCPDNQATTPRHGPLFHCLT